MKHYPGVVIFKKKSIYPRFILVFVLLMLIGLFTSCSANSRSAASAISPKEPPFPKTLKPFGKLTCSPFKQVIFCPGGVTKTYDKRVPSFDKVPLDADLTLPSTKGGPFTLIVMLHGLGGTKTDYEVKPNQPSPPAGSNNNVGLAKLGFAVLTYTARGFGESCGDPEFRTAQCAKGWQHLVDQRYEIRDTQYLAGLLVDEGIVKPTIGVTGVSYGGGQSVELALLNNRIRKRDGKFEPWVSPKYKVPMKIGAAFVMWGWFNLVQALAPEGNFVPSLSNDNPFGGSMIPSNPPFSFGDPLQSWVTLLIAATHLGYLAPINADPTANIIAWGNATLNSYNFNNPYLSQIAKELSTYKSGAGIPINSTVPAPIFMANGFTDPLFPASQALELYSYIKTRQPSATVDLFLGDLGHQWADNPSAVSNQYVSEGINFLVSELRGRSHNSNVTVSPVYCSESSTSLKELTAKTFSGLNVKYVKFDNSISPGNSLITSVSQNQQLSNNLNDLQGSYCKNVDDFIPNLKGDVDIDLSNYLKNEPTILGSPIIKLNFKVTGNDGGIVGRLFSVSPDGTSQLITRGVTLVKNTQTSISFALNPIYFKPTPNSKIVLDLVGSDQPSYRSVQLNDKFSITVTNVAVELPIHS